MNRLAKKNEQPQAPITIQVQVGELDLCSRQWGSLLPMSIVHTHLDPVTCPAIDMSGNFPYTCLPCYRDLTPFSEEGKPSFERKC